MGDPTDPCRRRVMGGIGAVLMAAACDRAPSQALAAPAKRVVSLSAMGVDRFSRRDQSAALARAFATAGADGIALLGDPDAHYRRDGPLVLDGVSFDGQGCTLGALSDGPQALRCVGKGWRIANLRILGTARDRSNQNLRNGIWVGDEDGPTATDFVLENVTVDAAAPGLGVATAGMMFSNAHGGRILRPVVRHSRADGIHITGGSSDLVFQRSLSEDTGDDGFAVVSYRSQRRICHNIRAVDGVSRRSAARGFAVAGGQGIVYERALVEQSSAAGFYLYGEERFDTYGVAQCQLLDPVARGCVTGRRLPSGFSNAAIVIGGRTGSDVVGGLTIARAATDCLVRKPVVEGVGDACTAGISTHAFAVRPRIVGATIRNLLPSERSRLPNGIEVGGRDVEVDGVRMENVAGLSIVVAPTASGNCVVTAPDVSGSRLRPGPINSYIYAEPAPALRRMIVRGGSFARGPARLSISLLPPDRLLLENNRLL